MQNADIEKQVFPDCKVLSNISVERQKKKRVCKEIITFFAEFIMP